VGKSPTAPSRTQRIPGSLGAIESRVGYKLHRTDLLLMDVMAHILAEIGLTPARATALAFITDHPGTGQSALAQALGINRASAMEVVNHLETLGAIKRKQGRDRRSNALHLTAKGERLHAAFLDATIEVDRVIAEELTPEEFAQFAEFLGRLRTSIDRRLGGDAPHQK
jgi:DNA-binding MarR family transcriptional regulator